MLRLATTLREKLLRRRTMSRREAGQRAWRVEPAGPALIADGAVASTPIQWN
jgi:hypothetical protein